MDTIPVGAFSLKSYAFTKAYLDFRNISSSKLNIELVPKGVYNASTCEFKLAFEVKIKSEFTETDIIDVVCEAVLQFQDKIAFSDIPDYFYANSLAILFPYVRAFISTLSLQANVKPIIIPTVNLSGLSEAFKRGTTEEM